MKKVIVGVLASHGDVYDAFKQVWLKNIAYTQYEPYNCKVIYKFFFIYGGDSEKILENENHTDLYYAYPETIPNMLRKTLRFFEHVKNTIFANENVFVLRTNLSTLFDFKLYSQWIDNVPSFFFGGSIIDGFHGKMTTFSGTNMIMSLDVMNFIVKHQDRFTYNQNEDIELSAMVMFNIGCNIKAMKRIDFVINRIIYHKCKLYAEDVCCYRFKSNNRKKDIENMDNILSCLKTNVNIKRFIQSQMENVQIVSEASEMDVLAERVWSIT
jgi:hypothetical protein